MQTQHGYMPNVPAIFLPGYRAMTDTALGDLDAYDSAIAELDAALTDAARERLIIHEAGTELALMEAQVSLTVEGRNEAERKARLTVALHENSEYEQARVRDRDARFRLADAERRVMVARERCRLLRCALEGASRAGA